MAEQFEHLGLADAVEAAVAGADHLSVKHAATVALARTLAARADMLAAHGWVDPETSKFDNVTTPTLLNTLKALGLTVEPAAAAAKSRKAEDVPPAPAAPSALGKLRQLHGGKAG